jgi:hypothetical protein
VIKPAIEPEEYVVDNSRVVDNVEKEEPKEEPKEELKEEKQLSQSAEEQGLHFGNLINLV